MPRSMRLSAELVEKVAPATGNHSAENLMAGRVLATELNHREMVRDVLENAPTSGLWLFAYGSLIWNPCFEWVERRPALAHGWRRSFCLGWDHWFRGSVERPGLMLALDRGGRCKGVAYRLPAGEEPANLMALMKREVHILPHPFPPRWVDLETEGGPIRALTFAMDRRSNAYVSGLSLDQIADALAVAAGPTGSMAEYLFNTVSKLEELGLRDRRLWRLQHLVAERIEANNPET